MLWVGIPGRHAPIQYDLANGLGPAGGLPVAHEGKWSDRTGSVAGNAVFVEDPGNLAGKGHRGLGGRSRRSTNNAAHRFHHGPAHALSRQQLLQGLHKIAFSRTVRT